MSDTELVWIPGSPSARTRKCYHTDSDCRYVFDTHVQVRRDNLPRGFGECKECSGESRTGTVQADPSLRTLIARGEVETREGSNRGVLR